MYDCFQNTLSSFDPVRAVVRVLAYSTIPFVIAHCVMWAERKCRRIYHHTLLSYIREIGIFLVNLF